MNTFKIFIMMSWRNLWRHRRRSVVVIMSIAIGIVAMMFSISFMNGINKQMVDNTISTSLGHIAVHSKGFQQNMKLKYNFYPDEKILSAVEKNNIYSYSKKLKIQAMLSSAKAVQGVMVVGIEPEAEKKVSNIAQYIVNKKRSSYLTDENSNQILISEKLAKKFNVKINSKIVLMVQDREKEIVGVALKVKGFFITPVESFDKFVVFMGLKKLQNITGLGNNVSEITILLKNKNDVDSVCKSLVSDIKNNQLEILTWKDMAPNLVKSIELFDKQMYIFFLIIFVTVVFSVANTLIMAIMERFHEIGVMKCIGTGPFKIFYMIIFEALNLGVIGLAFGIGIALLLHLVLSNVGINLSMFMESMRIWGSGSIIYPVFKADDFIVSIVIVFLTTFLASIYPAVKAARIKPLEAVNFI